MEVMTLREVCDACEVSRRAVQGYEKAGLVSASKRNERGYLLYDREQQEKIRQIKFYQKLGFKIREIKGLQGLSRSEMKETLKRQVKKLECENREKEELIKKAYELIERL